MADITAAMVKELRERTGAGMMECKKALVEANGDTREAEDIIAKSGHKKAAKSASRTAAEGRITIATSSKNAVIVETNCETDFVAKGDDFIALSEQVANVALKNNAESVEALRAMPYDNDTTVEGACTKLIARIGENIQVRRIECLEAKDNQHFGSYIHHARIGVVVKVEGGDAALAKDLAMHIAAMKPQYLTMQDVPADEMERQKAIFIEISQQSGKPMNIIEKMVTGQIQKHFAEICLEGQPFFKEPDLTIAAYLKKNNAKILQMVRLAVGEGIEVVKKSLAEEVSEIRGSGV